MAEKMGKTGGGGAASAQQESMDRRERLRKLALETIDLNKDPYFMRNHLGQYECKLCLTLHPNEGNYLAHTQGKRHQQNLGRRQARDSAIAAVQPAPALPEGPRKRGIKIGRPKHRVCKQWDPERRQRSLLFEVEYPEIEEGLQPRHRFMSAYEQRLEAPDRAWQYLLFAASPYETIAFKLPSLEVARDAALFHTAWDADRKVFTLQVAFKPDKKALAPGKEGGGP